MSIDSHITPYGASVPLDRLTPIDAACAGAKAYNCARLKQAGFRVPDGIVVLSTATDRDLAALAGHPWFEGMPEDTRFAVRSSGIGEKDSAQGGANVPSLTAAQLLDLSDVLTRIERWYGAPQDVEWCHDGAGFWIVQSRPVTAGRAHADEIEWTRANVAEVLPDLTSPQALAAFEDLLNQGQRRFVGGLMAPEDELGPMVKSFCGRLCFNLSQMRRICAIGGIAPAVMLRSVGHAGAIDPADEIAPRLSFRHLRYVPSLMRMVWGHARTAEIVRRHRARTEAYLAELSSRDPQQLSDAELWLVIDDWTRRAPDYIEAVLLLSNVLFHEMPLRKICERVGVSFEAFLYPQLATGERSVSAQQAYDLVALADVARDEPQVVQFLASDEHDLVHARTALRGTAFLAALERFLETYGHRGRYEYDWSLPRYAEDPTPLLLTLHAHLAAGASTADDARAMAARQDREAAEAWASFERALTPWQRRTMTWRVRRSIAKIKQYYVWREQVRSDLVRIIGAQRAWHLVLADRFVERGWLDRRDDYFLLKLPEIASILQDTSSAASPARSIVARRVAELARYAAMQMPLLMRESELPSLVRMARVSGAAADENDLSGQAVSGGCVEAEVGVVRDPGDFGRMKRGAILVAPATDPSWTPLFTLASGVIVEVGGVLSHASTIAREYGLPAIANVRHATRRLRTGDRVRLDANNGLVQRLTPPPAATAPACASTTQEQKEIAPAQVRRRKAS